MEDIFGMIWVFVVIIVLIVKSTKDRQQKRARRNASDSHPYAARPAPKRPSFEEAFDDEDEDELPVFDLEPKPIKPTVHVHSMPDCDIHDVPGSLGEVSTEGKDDCHEAQLASMRRERPDDTAPPAEQPGLQLDWTGDNMVKAFVMQEVLKRPCERRAR